MAIDRVRDHPIIVILDTNALFVPFKFKINLDSELCRLFGEYEIIIPSCVFQEAKRLQGTEKFGSKAFALAQSKVPPDWYKEFEAELFSKKSEDETKIQHRETYNENYVDNKILQIAKALDGIVITNDKAFLKRLNEVGIRTILLRSRKYLKLNLQF